MSSGSSNGGIGVPTVLLVVFIVLKMTDNIDWSWFWVLSPFWIPVGVLLTLATLWVFLWWIPKSIWDKRKSNRKLKEMYEGID